MKKLFLFVITLVCTNCCNIMAQVIHYKIAGKSIIISFHETDNMSLEQTITEFKKGLDIANKKKCKTVLICNNQGSIWELYHSPNRVWDYSYSERLRNTIKNMNSTDVKNGPVVGKERVYKNVPAMYVSKTYVNGRLKDTYTSEWRGSEFKQKNSTYNSGGSTWRTETHYEPSHQELVGEKEIYEYTKVINIDGFTNFVKDIVFTNEIIEN